MMITPLSTSFVTIDRILSLASPTFPRNQRKFLIQIPSLLTICVCYLNTTYLTFTRSRYPWPSAPCLVLSCYMPKGSMRDLMMAKFVFSIINVILGSVFIYLYYRHNKTLIARRERKKNYIVFTVIISETIFSIFPTCIFIVADVFSLQFASRFGPFMTMGHALDVLLFTLLFYRTWMAKSHTVGHMRSFMRVTPIHSSQTEGQSRKY